MSVVNKMLQDLEARQSQSSPACADYHPPQQSRGVWWLTLIIALLLLLVLWLWLSQDKQDNPSEQIRPSMGDSAQQPQSSPPPVVAKVMGSSPPALETELQLSKGTMPDVSTTLAESSPGSELARQAVNVNLDVKVSAKRPTNTAEKERVSAVPEQEPTYPVAAEKKLEIKALVLPLKQAASLDSQQSQSSEFSISSSGQAAKAEGKRQGVINALNSGNTSLAVERLQILLADQPDNVAARKKLASLLFAQGSDSQAKQVLEQGLAGDPSRSDLRLMLARLYVQQQQNEQAIALLEGFEPSVEIQTEYWAYRAALAQQLGLYPLSKADYVQLTQAEPRKSSWWLGLAIAEDRLGNNTQALEAYRRANNSKQLSPSVMTFIGQRIAVIGATL